MIKTKQDNDVTDCTYAVYVKMKPTYRDRQDWVWSVMKTKHDNDVTDHIDLVYAETKIEMLGPI